MQNEPTIHGSTDSGDRVTLSITNAPSSLFGYLDEVRLLIDAELDRRFAPPALEDDPGRLFEAMHYAVTGPGKRLRPAMAIAAAEACGASREVAIPAAVAIEMIHTYTLVHDDLPAMDDDDIRRGRSTVHVAFGEAIAILAGDGLLTAAFGALAELGPRAGAAVAVLARRGGARELLGGQAIDVTVPPAELREITAVERLHAAKTGALFAAAAELGAVAAGASPEICARLGRYGMAIGIAFQHADDRDDADLVELAAVAATRMRTLCEEARELVRPFGPRGAMLDGFATWIAGRA
ncbi:MAG TPA: polyprenyl synthetase family protein [Kofleriaceae bacterium]|nr:polyprenyl synthetase family protein [Kofleriaceae bacterium]